MHLFSWVVVMAAKVDSDATDVYSCINAITFDIQDYKNAADDGTGQTVFTYDEGGNYSSSVQLLHWDILRHQFSQIISGKTNWFSEQKLKDAIYSHWTARLHGSHPYTNTSRQQNRLWAPTITIFHSFKDEQQIMQIDNKMDTALKNVGALARAYSFIRTRTAHLTYALFHHSIKKPRTPMQIQMETLETKIQEVKELADWFKLPVRCGG